MKATLLCLFGLFVFCSSSAQLGVGTTQPTQMLHVDSGNIKLGSAVWSSSANDRRFSIGDGSFVTIGEEGADDRLRFRASQFQFSSSTGSTDGRVGIGTTSTPTERLEVVGKIKMTDGNQAAGKVLTSNANGVGTWQTPVVSSPSQNTGFRARFTLGNTADGVSASVTYDTTNALCYDDGQNLNLTTGYEVPATGVYHFDIFVRPDLQGTAGAGATYALTVIVNGSAYSIHTMPVATNASSVTPLQVSFDGRFNAGDDVRFAVSNETGTTIFINPTTSQYFTGHRVY